MVAASNHSIREAVSARGGERGGTWPRNDRERIQRALDSLARNGIDTGWRTDPNHRVDADGYWVRVNEDEPGLLDADGNITDVIMATVGVNPHDPDGRDRIERWTADALEQQGLRVRNEGYAIVQIWTGR